VSIPAWLAKWRVTSDWAAHRARGSLGGIDWATPTGTPIYAPSDGIVDFRFYGDGSSVIRIRRADNTRTEFLHGTFLGGNFRPVKAGERVGTSDGRRGTRGAGSSTGPHVHAHDVTAAGVRVPPFSTIRNARPTITDTEQDDDMRLVKRNEGTPEWSLFHPSFRGPSEKERGYYVITDPDEALAWARLLYKGAGSEQSEPRNVYITLQAVGHVAHANYLYGLPTAPSGDTVAPTAEQIATEVIRQQKLPGN